MTYVRNSDSVRLCNTTLQVDWKCDLSDCFKRKCKFSSTPKTYERLELKFEVSSCYLQLVFLFAVVAIFTGVSVTVAVFCSLFLRLTVIIEK